MEVRQEEKITVGKGQIAESIQAGEQICLVIVLQARCAQSMVLTFFYTPKINRQMEKK